MPVEKARDIFEHHMPSRIKNKPEIVEKLNTKYKFIVTGDEGGTWLVDLTKPGGEVSEQNSEANCTITVGSKDLVDLINGKLNPQMAFITGKVKVSGDMGLAMKLGTLLG